MRSRQIILLMAASTMALSGCASTGLGISKPKKAQILAEVPAAPMKASLGQRGWAEPAPNRLPTTQWVGDFNDTMLTELIDEALRANPSIGAARARLEAAEAQAKSARSGLYPSVNGTGRAGRNQAFENVIGGSSSYSLGLSVNWEADLWGRVKDTALAGDLEAQASNADLAGARLAIAGAVSQTWFNLIEAQLLNELAQRNVETQERALRLTKRRFDGGISGASDYRLARSAVASAKATLALRAQNQSATARSLETLLRRYPEDKIAISTNLPELPNLQGAGTPSDMFLRRPDILAAERRLQAQGVRIDIANKNLYPRLTLDAGLNSGAGPLQRLFSLDNLIASITGGLTQPIFQGGAIRADIARNEAVLHQQLEGYADTVLTAYLEVENALDAEKLLGDREQALAVSLKEAQKAEDRLEQRYSEGLASILQLLVSQTLRFNAESALISAKKERLANRVRLQLALGGGVYGEETQREKLAKPTLKLAGL